MTVGDRDLPINKIFIVERFAKMENKFGSAVLAILYDEDTGDIIEVYLPKAVYSYELSEAEVEYYNSKPLIWGLNSAEGSFFLFQTYYFFLVTCT